ncbi:MAG: cytochrome ubiquinol oxidase subunit I [Planctomycetaceae bacterium]|jgi:cytochrome bd-type quinol oxidase subunit 1|nr:cytochrome ubiquinol oxidase subunit I [Planctomycetaceae bacterium]
MHYPWWYVPGITAPMLIAVVAVVHVIVSHYAVGGGILLARENQYALKKGLQKYRQYWKDHARFFVLLTVAFGAITGVGIWWTIGIASPTATEQLIRTFVFGWAIEWVFFLIEIVAAFAFFYYWDRLPGKTHVIIGWIYALAAWISLVLITGITAFMLNQKGLIADWSETQNFWHAFFNVQFLPQMIARTGASLMLGAVYVYLHAAWKLQNDEELKALTVRRMAGPALRGIVLLVTGVAGWYVYLPDNAKLMIETAPSIQVIGGLFAASVAVLFVMILFGSLCKPKSMNLGFAVCLLLFGFAAFASAEFVREALRKPYIVDRLVLGNQITTEEIADCQRYGFLEHGEWTSEKLRRMYPDLWSNETGDHFDETLLLQRPEEERIQVGEMLFMYHCNNCHASQTGFSAVAPLIFGESREKLVDFLKNLNQPKLTMPPWCGNDAEAELLTEYLLSIQRKPSRD